MNPLSIALVLPFSYAAVFFLGRMFERMQWNKLIKRGIIPTPKGY